MAREDSSETKCQEESTEQTACFLSAIHESQTVDNNFQFAAIPMGEMQNPISCSPILCRCAYLTPVMKSHILISFCVLAVSATFAIADDTPLAKHMEALDDSYKAIRKTEDPSKGAVLAREAQTHVVKSLSELPEMLSKMPDGPARAKAAASYRLMMGQLYIKLCEVELAFLDNKLDKVAELVDGIKDLKKKGHTEFMEE